MVFDNHDDPSSFHLPDFMPPGQHSRIFITSRRADTTVLTEPGHDIELPGLPKDDACDLLIRQSRAGDAASREDAYTIYLSCASDHTSWFIYSNSKDRHVTIYG